MFHGFQDTAIEEGNLHASLYVTFGTIKLKLEEMQEAVGGGWEWSSVKELVSYAPGGMCL